MPGARKSHTSGLVPLLCLVLLLCLEGTAAVAQPCPPAGDSNQEHQAPTVCRANAAPVVQAGDDQFVSPHPTTGRWSPVKLDGSRSADPDGDALSYRWQVTAKPPGSQVTAAALSAPREAVTRFLPDVVGQYRLTLTVRNRMGQNARDTVIVNAQDPEDLLPEPCDCAGEPGEVVPLSVRLVDARSDPVPHWPVRVTVTQGDGVLIGGTRRDLALENGGRRLTPLQEGGAESLAERQAGQSTATVLTDANGSVTVGFQLGPAALQVVAFQAEALPNDPVLFRITLGPLAGNGIRPVNLALGGGRGYTANSHNQNISVFDATSQSFAVTDVIDFSHLIPEQPGVVGILGVAVNVPANRLYVYGELKEMQPQRVILLAVDTTTNRLVTPHDPDRDGVPGLTLFTMPEPRHGRVVLAPGRILGSSFGNLLTVDVRQGRVYAVAPGVVETTDTEPFDTVRIVDGKLVVVDASSDRLTVIKRLPVGEVPTGVAVNTQTNRVYVTNRGYTEDEVTPDTLTVINARTLTVSDTITVGHTPVGVQLDERHNVIYVANLSGRSVSVIDGMSHTVVQTIPAAGTTDLAVVVGAETAFLPVTIDRLYVGNGTVIDCDVTALATPGSCQQVLGLRGLSGKLAINSSRTRLFGARADDNAVAVLKLTTNTVLGEISTGVLASGLAIERRSGSSYVSDMDGDQLLAVDRDGGVTAIDVHSAGGFPVSGQVEADTTNSRIYVIGRSLPPLLVLDSTTRESVATLTDWRFGALNVLGIDARRNLLYMAESSNKNRLLVFDAARFAGETRVNEALLANITVGAAHNIEVAQGLAVDTERNLIYVTRFCLPDTACRSHALVVLRGAELDPVTRALVQRPQVLAEIPQIELAFGGGRRQIAVDPHRHLLYVTGAFDAISGSIEQGNAKGFGSTAITVLDALKIVDAQGQVTPNPAAAILGILRLKVLRDANGEPIVPIETVDYSSPELAFNAAEGLLYALTTPIAPFREGFISVLNSRLVLDAKRNFNTTPHALVSEAPQALIATLPAGIEPTFLAVDTARNRVAVTNQSLGALSYCAAYRRADTPRLCRGHAAAGQAILPAAGSPVCICGAVTTARVRR